MNKAKVFGIIAIVALIAGAIGYKYAADHVLINALLARAKRGEAQSVKATGLSIGPVSGYSLGGVELEGKQVPLIEIPLDTWGGYACLFAANAGQTEPSASSLFYKLGKFAVRLVHAENATEQLNGFAAGKYPIIWSGMDSLPLIADALKSDRRVRPQVFGVFDWSAGGDGIVVKAGIKTPKDLKGKTILSSGNTPQNFFLSWLLAQSDISPKDVKLLYLPDGPKAYQAFKAKKDIAAWVTWSPFLEEASDAQSKDSVPGARVLISSKDASQLIADVCVTRADFAKDHPEMLEAFLAALFTANDSFAKDPASAYAAMTNFYSLGTGQAAADMVASVHLANFAETQNFFNLDNPASAYKIFFMAEQYQKDAGALSADFSLSAEDIIDANPLAAIAAKKQFAHQTNRLAEGFKRQSSYDIADLESQKIVLAEDIDIHFDAQQVEFDPNSQSQDIKENLQALSKVAEQMSVLGTTVVKLVGHLDTSKMAEYKAKGQADFIEAQAQAKLLSKKRAEFIKRLLVQRYKIDPERLVTEGKGWDGAIEGADAGANRRVEVHFLSFE
jgi:NitT/TauT family transport system substrate-binding protein